MMKYAKTFLMDSNATYPDGQKFDRMVVIEDATFDTLEVDWEYGNTGNPVTQVQLPSLAAGQVIPGVIKNVDLGGGIILLSRSTVN